MVLIESGKKGTFLNEVVISSDMHGNHLRQGEIKELFSYLMANSRSLEEHTTQAIAITKDKNDVPEEFEGPEVSLAELVHNLDQGLARDNQYGQQSSFGRAYDDIAQNAQAHFRSCLACMTEYELCVRAKALKDALAFLSLFRTIDVDENDSFTKRYRGSIRVYDFLGLLGGCP